MTMHNLFGISLISYMLKLSAGQGFHLFHNPNYCPYLGTNRINMVYPSKPFIKAEDKDWYITVLIKIRSLEILSN